MTNEFNSANLNISKNAYGRRTNSSQRVEYLIDPDGDEDLGYGIPEKVVISRWKSRSNDKHSFGGIRLSPNVWRSIRLALGDDAASIHALSLEEINQKYLAAKSALKLAKFPTVSGQKIIKLCEGLGTKNFNALMQRHNHSDRCSIYGTPDLYLWALKKRTRKLSYIRFVEVKKPREPLSADQKKELLFLNEALKVKACCFQFKEVS